MWNRDKGAEHYEVWSSCPHFRKKCGKCCLDQYEDLLSSSEDCHMNISCSMDWVMVSVGPCAYSSSLYIFADELYLGLGCPVTRIQAYAYDFIYPVHDCGIRTKVVSEDTLLFQTEIYFNPRNTHCDCQKIPLECSASRKSVWLTLVSTDNEIRLDPSPFIADFETTPEENPSETKNESKQSSSLAPKPSQHHRKILEAWNHMGQRLQNGKTDDSALGITIGLNIIATY
ncbi:Oocyte-secreted protein 2 [Manis javanica]|nr:Oocyte-secreted protein 2 [Manis javanica]